MTSFFTTIVIATAMTIASATTAVANPTMIDVGVVPFGNENTVQIRVTLFENPSPPAHCSEQNGRKLSWFLIGGYAFTAEAWQPFATELFQGDVGTVCNVLAIDLPAHGNSGIPQPTNSFSDISFDDYAEVVENVLEVLSAQPHKFSPQTIAGHSMGAEIIQQMQARTIAMGEENLFKRFKISKVVLLAPPPTIEGTWIFGDADILFNLDPPLFEQFEALFGDNIEGLGDVINFEKLGGATFDSNWQLVDENLEAVFDDDGNPVYVQNAPLHLVGQPEPFTMSKETVSYFDEDLNIQFHRPSLEAGSFASNKVELFSVGFSRDTSVFAFEAEATHLHLVGNLDGYVTVDTPEAVHGMPFSDPVTVVEALSTLLH